MRVQPNRVVSLTYLLRDAEGGEELDQRGADDLFHYLHGHNNIISGMEETLQGLKAGDKFDVKLEPADAYGEYNPKLTQTLSRDDFPDGFELEPGVIIELIPQDGPDDAPGMAFYISEINGDAVLIDGNPPMAGRSLHFVGEVVEVRDADSEEIAHGHAHIDGHHPDH